MISKSWFGQVFAQVNAENTQFGHNVPSQASLPNLVAKFTETCKPLEDHRKLMVLAADEFLGDFVKFHLQEKVSQHKFSGPAQNQRDLRKQKVR